MSLRMNQLSIALGCAFGLLALPVSAQSIIVENGPATNKTIPLEANSKVSVDPGTGDLLVKCALTNAVCAPLAGGGGAGAPTSSFTRTDTDTDVRTGEFVSFSWTSSNAKACAAGATGPSGFTGFNGVRNLDGTETVTLSAVGDYSFNFQCFNASGGSVQQTVAVTVTQSDTPPPQNCSAAPDPQLQPAGWNRVNKTWVANWSAKNNSAVAIYPESASSVVAFGAEKGAYSVVGPFTANPNQTIRIYWETAQANNGYGYNNPRPAESMWIGISPCPGDFRTTDNLSADPFRRGGCRKHANSDTLIFSSTAFETNETSCHVEPGQQYYMNVIAADPENGLTAGEHTCTAVPNSANGCDVQGNHRVVQ